MHLIRRHCRKIQFGNDFIKYRKNTNDWHTICAALNNAKKPEQKFCFFFSLLSSLSNWADVVFLTTLTVYTPRQTFSSVWRHVWWFLDLGGVEEGPGWRTCCWKSVTEAGHISDHPAVHRTVAVSHTSKNSTVQVVSNSPVRHSGSHGIYFELQNSISSTILKIIRKYFITDLLKWEYEIEKESEHVVD